MGLHVILDIALGHSGYVTRASPKGMLPVGEYTKYIYPDSLPYFTEVVKYWIDEYEVDGYRIDSSKDLFQNGHNYLKEIREAVYEACNARRKEDKKYGILGYVVGDDNEDVRGINEHAYGDEGVKSNIDYPSRHYLVTGLAQNEDGYGGYGIRTFSNVHCDLSQKGYVKDSYQQLFMTNKNT